MCKKSGKHNKFKTEKEVDMTEYSKYNIIYRLQRWLDSVPGQTFLNYAYSWGASIVILGTLFKLTHLPGANIMLYFGMGTEVIVFFISAFDRPFDKTAIGKEIPTHVGKEYSDDEDFDVSEAADYDAPVAAPHVAEQGVPGGSVVYINAGGARPQSVSDGVVSEGDGIMPSDGGQESAGGGYVAGESHAAAAGTAPQGVPVQQLSTGWIAAQQQVSPEMEEATSNYVEELKKLTDMLAKVSEQSARLTRDSEEMENLNRTLTGICKVYEMQLKGASSQIGTIDQINEQSRKMASQIEQLNKIYARMIEAMTVNMRAATNNGNNAEV